MSAISLQALLKVSIVSKKSLKLLGTRQQLDQKSLLHNLIESYLQYIKVFRIPPMFKNMGFLRRCW